jgi:hypothetical protein
VVSGSHGRATKQMFDGPHQRAARTSANRGERAPSAAEDF